MSKKVMFFVALLVLNLYGLSYASGPISGDKRVSVSSSGSKDMSPSQVGQFSRSAAPASSRSSDGAAQTRSMPNVAERRAEVQNSIKELIIFSQKSSSDIRREIKRIKAQKNKRINDADIKRVLDIADELDKYARLLQQKEKSLADNDRDIDEGLRQTLVDMSQLDMSRLQDAMNQQSQLMQMMSNIQKMMHDTCMSIIRNLK